MASSREPILVACPPGPVRDEVLAAIAAGGATSRVASTVAEALAALSTFPHAIVVASLDLPEGGALALLAERRRSGETEIVVVASEPDVPRAVEAMRAGASDFLVLPIDLAALELSLEKAALNAVVADRVPQAPMLDERLLLGSSRAMQEVRALVARVAPTTANVLVRGESGTGKEMVARALHEASPRKAGPLVKLNCGALPDSLLESELFGYERGAFTGAVTAKPGRIELAHGGTLLLDEIGDITPAMQVKLLRVVQHHEVERLGGRTTIHVDVRFVAATHRPLEAMIERGEFREDLFYRLNVVPIWLPPLRARREDIAVLAEHFCSELSVRYAKRALLSPDAIALLRRERWQGNVRQLQNVVERLVVLAEGAEIGADDVQRQLAPQHDFTTQAPSVRVAEGERPSDLDAARASAEREAVVDALRRASGNRTVAARLLGISRRTLYNKLDELGVD